MGMLNLPVVRPRRVVFNPRDYPHINDLPQFKIRDINELITKCFKLPRRLGNRSESLIRSELEDYFSRLLGVRDASRLIVLKVDADDPALQLALKHAYRFNRRPSEFDEVKKFISDVIEPRRNSIYVGGCNRPSAYGTFILLGNIIYGTIFTPRLQSTGYYDDAFTSGCNNSAYKCVNNVSANGGYYYSLGYNTVSYNNGTSINTAFMPTNYYPISSYDIPQFWGIQYAPYVYSTNPLTLLTYGSWTASSSWTRNYIDLGTQSNQVSTVYCSGMYIYIPIFYATQSGGFSVSNGVSYVSEWEIIYS
jgi:hypothetical protein